MNRELDTAPLVGREEWAGLSRAIGWGLLMLAGAGLIVWGVLSLLFWYLGGAV